jgi:integrase
MSYVVERKSKTEGTSSTWAVVYRAADPVSGKRRQVWESGFATEREAKRRCRKIDEALEAGRHAVPRKLTVGEYLVEKWLPTLEARDLKPNTVASYRTQALCHLVPRIGGLQLQAVTPERLDALYGVLRTSGRRQGPGGLSSTSVRLVHVTISKALGDAVDWGYLASNPATRAKAVPGKTETTTEMETWTPTQLRVFLGQVADDRLLAMWVLFITTGMRRGEVAGLRWSDLDLDAGELNVKQARVSVDYAVVTGTPKSRSSVRTFGLDEATVMALRGHKARQAAERLAWGSGWTDTGLVFVREDGTAFHPDRIRQIFKAHTRRAGLPPIRLHDLRHSYATAALEAGVELLVVSKRLGHSSIGITGDVYSHVRKAHDAKAAETTAAYIFGA